MQTSGKEKMAADLQKLENELEPLAASTSECNECPPPPAEDVKHWNAVMRKFTIPKFSIAGSTTKMIAYLNWYRENLVKNIPLYDK